MIINPKTMKKVNAPLSGVDSSDRKLGSARSPKFKIPTEAISRRLAANASSSSKKKLAPLTPGPTKPFKAPFSKPVKELTDLNKDSIKYNSSQDSLFKKKSSK